MLFNLAEIAILVTTNQKHQKLLHPPIWQQALMPDCEFHSKAIGQSGSDWDRSGQTALARPNWWHRPEMEHGNCRTLSILAATWRSAHLAPPGAQTTWPTWRSIHLACCQHPPGAKPTWRPPGAETTWRPPGAQPTWPTWRMAHRAMATIFCNVFKWTTNCHRILIVQMKVPGGP